MFLEYEVQPYSLTKYFFARQPKHMITLIDFVGTVRVESFDYDSHAQSLERLTFHKQCYELTDEKLSNLLANANTASKNPPNYTRHAKANSSPMDIGENCASFLVALLASVDVPVATGPLGSIVLRPIDITADSWSWLFNLFITGMSEASRETHALSN